MEIPKKGLVMKEKPMTEEYYYDDFDYDYDDDDWLSAAKERKHSYLEFQKRG